MSTQNYNFDVEVITDGQPKPYAASIYHCFVIDKTEKSYGKYLIGQFCTQFLHKGYPKDEMPDPFAGEILIFRQIEERKWEYKVRYTQWSLS